MLDLGRRVTRYEITQPQARPYVRVESLEALYPPVQKPYSAAARFGVYSSGKPL
jgi:hypothetical protein